MAILTSYDLNGKKDSFANWISNLSPVDTFFVSVTKKEQVKNTLFQWQTDSLAAASATNAQKESDNAVMADLAPTKIHQNVTQILRKALEVTDTADAVDSWGRNKELAYQMEKAGLEIKRDLELILLQKAQDKVDGSEEDVTTSTGAARKTASFGKLVAQSNETDADTGAKTWIKSGVANSLTEAKLFEVTYNLYLAGSNANIIMFHPKHAAFFSSLMETAATRTKLIENMDTTLNKFVGSIIDPLGQQYKLVPNRFMPTDAVYFFNPVDWTQMVLREPSKMPLAKKGSSERFMIEMEVGLRHKHPFASGVLELVAG
ncbi:MAG: SU10 major capsid protein [Bacteroidales bacterium]